MSGNRAGASGEMAGAMASFSLSWPDRTAQAIANPVDVTVVSCRRHPNHRLWNMDPAGAGTAAVNDENCEKRNSAAPFLFCSAALSSRSHLELWRDLSLKSA